MIIGQEMNHKTIIYYSLSWKEMLMVSPSLVSQNILILFYPFYKEEDNFRHFFKLWQKRVSAKNSVLIFKEMYLWKNRIYGDFLHLLVIPFFKNRLKSPPGQKTAIFSRTWLSYKYWLARKIIILSIYIYFLNDIKIYFQIKTFKSIISASLDALSKMVQTQTWRYSC